ncbi:MAG: glycine cleavage system protein GcvH [Bacteroidales bacterium]
MEVKANLKYAKSHEWVLIEGSKAKIGISDFAQHALGDVVYISIPEEGDTVVAGEPFADVESVKAASDIYSPVTGTVVAVNEVLNDTPALLNEDPYGAWIIEVEVGSLSDDLMDAGQYEAYCAEQ